MKTNKNIINLGLLAVIALALLPCVASAQETKTLHGHVPAAVSRLNLKSEGQLPANTSMDLVISLPLRDEAALDAMLQQVYDSSSTNYHNYLTPGEFASQFGPTEKDYLAVVNFAKNNGLAVVNTYSNKLILDVRGNASAVEKAFHVTMQTYHHPSENRDFYAPDVDPTVDAALPVLHISGLDNYLLPHPGYVKKDAANNSIQPGTKSGLGSGPFGTYMGKDFRAAYVPGVSLDGTGQNVALFELDGYFTSDILSYESQAGLANTPLINIAVDGGVPNPTGFGDPEVSLDIEMVISMATNLSAVMVYEAPNGLPNSSVDLLNRIASDDIAKQISSSWLIGDSPAFDVFYKEMALQGQSFFQCSGDNGAFYSNNEQIQEWADDTNITVVGGTTLSTTGPGGAWSSETVWNWLSTGEGNAGSGGGTNFNGIQLPSWQQGISMAANGGSTTLRNVPDVALTADNIYVTFENGSSGDFGGTSAATPLWAAFTALVNEDALANSKPTVGFLNPALYSIGSSANYANCFHDITTGNNTNLVVGNRYFATTGYDLCTGLGTPNGINLISALLSISVINPITHLSPPLPPYGGTMSALNGNNPNGNWYLFVEDDQVLNAGGITNGWSLTLTTANPVGYVADDYLAMSASATNILPNANVTFNIGVTNYGPSASSNVMVADTFPAGFTLVSSSPSVGTVTPNGLAVNWNVGNLTNSQGAQLSLTLQAPNAGELDVLNLAGVSAATPDQNSADGSAFVTLNVVSTAAPTLNAGMGGSGKFLLSVSGVSLPVTIQASTNLINWVNISTNTPPFTFTDSVFSGFPDRFYRAVVQ